MHGVFGIRGPAPLIDELCEHLLESNDLGRLKIARPVWHSPTLSAKWSGRRCCTPAETLKVTPMLGGHRFEESTLSIHGRPVHPALHRYPELPSHCRHVASHRDGGLIALEQSLHHAAKRPGPPAEQVPHLHHPAVVFPDRFGVASCDQVDRHRHFCAVDLAGFEGFDEQPADDAFQLTRNPNQHVGLCCKALTSSPRSAGQLEVRAVAARSRPPMDCRIAYFVRLARDRWSPNSSPPPRIHRAALANSTWSAIDTVGAAPRCTSWLFPLWPLARCPGKASGVGEMFRGLLLVALGLGLVLFGRLLVVPGAVHHVFDACFALLGHFLFVVCALAFVTTAAHIGPGSSYGETCIRRPFFENISTRNSGI
jgi:hypothetical protein